MPDHTKHYQITPDHDQTTPNHTTQLRQQQQPTAPNQTQQTHRPGSEFKTKVQFNKQTNLNTSIKTRNNNSVKIIWKVFGNKLTIILEGAGQDFIYMQNVLFRNHSRMF
jgi:LAS superfamily LD-carboxypeptidase LdcB